MASSFGLGVRQGGSTGISRHEASLAAPPGADDSSITDDGKVIDTDTLSRRAFKRWRSFSSVLQNCTRGTNGQVGYLEDANGGIPEYDLQRMISLDDTSVSCWNSLLF